MKFKTKNKNILSFFAIAFAIFIVIAPTQASASHSYSNGLNISYCDTTFCGSAYYNGDNNYGIKATVDDVNFGYRYNQPYTSGYINSYQPTQQYSYSYYYPVQTAQTYSYNPYYYGNYNYNTNYNNTGYSYYYPQQAQSYVGGYRSSIRDDYYRGYNRITAQINRGYANSIF